MELVAVTSVGDIGLANIVRDVLEQAGIEATIQGAGSEDVFPGAVLGQLQVMVAESDLPAARDVLERFEVAPDDDDEEED